MTHRRSGSPLVRPAGVEITAATVLGDKGVEVKGEAVDAHGPVARVYGLVSGFPRNGPPSPRPAMIGP